MNKKPYLKLSHNSSTINNNIKNKIDIQVSPFVKSLFTGVKISADLDYKEEYTAYLAKKYQ